MRYDSWYVNYIIWWDKIYNMIYDMRIITYHSSKKAKKNKGGRENSEYSMLPSMWRKNKNKIIRVAL